MAGVEKLKQLILYVSELGDDDPKLGAIKLNKILYYSDVRAYLELGHSITDAAYQHLSEGPAPFELLRARDELQQEGAITIEPRRYFNLVQQRIVVQRPPDLSNFTEAEISIVREVMTFLAPLNAAEVTLLSHQEWGWKLTDEGDEIPYRTAWLSAEPLTEEQIRDGQRLWRETVDLA